MKEFDDLYARIEQRSQYIAGYPTNTVFQYNQLWKFLNFNINNVGDPYDDNLFACNTHEIEQEVIEWFAKLFNSSSEHWGYVTNGGTEGNMHGLYLARESWPDGMVYMSEDTHYSVMKTVHMLRMKHVIVKSESNGEISYDDLDDMIHMNRDKPAIIMANIGTTMKGAFDNVHKIKNVLKKHAIRRKYIHCDAALYGMILPFIMHAPHFDFSAGIDSISVSGHKLIGLPIPAGIVVARKNAVERVKVSIEYIGAHDTTISGSRNGFTPLLIYYAIKKQGIDGFKAIVNTCYENTQYLLKRLTEIDWTHWINDFSTTVVIRRPPDYIIRKWQMAVCEEWSHIIVMPQMTIAKIDELIEDLKEERWRD